MVDETEAEVVRQMYRWLVEEELTSSAIAKRLAERGVARRKGGDPSGWAQSTVSDMLTNTFYKGVGYYNRTKKVDALANLGWKGVTRTGELATSPPRPYKARRGMDPAQGPGDRRSRNLLGFGPGATQKEWPQSESQQQKAQQLPLEGFACLRPLR